MMSGMDWDNVEINNSKEELQDSVNDSPSLSGLSANPETLHIDVLKRAIHLGDAISQHTRMNNNTSLDPESHYNKVAGNLEIENIAEELNGITIDSGLIIPLMGCSKDSVSLELGSMENQKIVRLKINLEETNSKNVTDTKNYFERTFALPEGYSELQAFWNTGQLEIRYR